MFTYTQAAIIICIVAAATWLEKAFVPQRLRKKPFHSFYILLFGLGLFLLINKYTPWFSETRDTDTPLLTFGKLYIIDTWPEETQTLFRATYKYDDPIAENTQAASVGLRGLANIEPTQLEQYFEIMSQGIRHSTLACTQFLKGNHIQPAELSIRVPYERAKILYRILGSGALYFLENNTATISNDVFQRDFMQGLQALPEENRMRVIAILSQGANKVDDAAYCEAANLVLIAGDLLSGGSQARYHKALAHLRANQVTP